MTKPKSVNQVFREGLRAARLGLTPVRGHYVTPEELGADVGVTGQTIRNYESGESEPSLIMIERLAHVMSVELGWPPFGGIVLPPTEGTTPVPELVPGKGKRRA